jgi:hypothetical protein
MIGRRNGEITAVAARLLESYPEIRRFARLSGWSGTDSNLHATFSAISKAPLAASGIGEENETPLVDCLEQDEPDG